MMTNTVTVATVDGSKKRNRLDVRRVENEAADADKALKFALLEVNPTAAQW